MLYSKKLKHIYNMKTYMSMDLGNDHNQWKINFMNELIDVVHQPAESGLSLKEAKDILGFLASN